MQFADVLIFREVSPSMRDFVWGLRKKNSAVEAGVGSTRDALWLLVLGFGGQ